MIEKQEVVGGLWAQLPAWQAIQTNQNDWTLGDLPITGTNQASIARNIHAWVGKLSWLRCSPRNSRLRVFLTLDLKSRLLCFIGSRLAALAYATLTYERELCRVSLGIIQGYGQHNTGLISS